MNLSVDLKLLINNKLSIQQWLLIMFIQKREKTLIDEYMNSSGKFKIAELEDLINRGFLKKAKESENLFFENLLLTEKCRIFAEKELDWFDEWYDLFPDGIKSGKYYIKGDKNGCRSKLLKFTKKYPEFTKDIILEATRSYIERFSRRNDYSYMVLATNFISKNDTSLLASECENVGKNQQFNFIREG